MSPGVSGSLGLRLLHLNSRLTGGGTDHHCLQLVAGLRGLGYTVGLAGPEDSPLGPQARGLGDHWFDTGAEGPLKARLVLRLARHLRRARISLVHAHHGRDYWPAVLAARLSGVRPKIVLTRHLAKSPSSWFSRRFLLNQCDLVIAVSEFTARVMREGALEPDSPEPERRARPPLRGDHRRVQVAYGGIDTERFRPTDAAPQRQAWGLEPPHYAFAVVGGYDAPRGKGQREFLEAAARVHEAIPNARFLIVGRGNLKATLETDIARLGLRGKAWLTPYCHQMPLAMNALDCLVHPQVGTEAFGLVVLEAFACGKPVIASALDGIPEAFAVGDYGRLIPSESVPALAEALVAQAAAVPATPSQRHTLYERVARAFSLPAAAQRVAALYQRLGSG